MVVNEKNSLTLAYEAAYDNQTWAWFFDEMDYLMGMVVIWENKDMSKPFETQLEIVCAKVDARRVFEEFKR